MAAHSVPPNFFQKSAEAWLESRKPFIAAKTSHEYQLNIKTLTAHFGDKQLHEITADDVRAYQQLRLSQNCGPFGINHECGVLVQMRKRLGKPFDDYQPLPLPKEKRGRALLDHQKAKLFAVAESNPNWLGACLFARISVNTTAGPKEVMTLRRKDIDLEKRVLFVQPGGAKNVHRIRRIPLNDDALEAAHLALERAKSLGSSEPDHYVFPFLLDKGKQYDPTRHQTTFKTAWKRIIAEADLPGFRMYDLRHTAITVLLENPNVSEETAETIAGHISKEIKKHYSHVRIETMRDAVNMLARKRVKLPRPKPSVAVDNQVARLLEGLAKLLAEGKDKTEDAA